MITSAHTWRSSGEIDLFLGNHVIHSSVHIFLSGFRPGSARTGSGEGEKLSRQRPQHRTFGFSSPRTGRGSRARGERQECREWWFWLPPGTNSHPVLKSNCEVIKERVSVRILPFQTDSGRAGLDRKGKRHKIVAQFSSVTQSGPTVCDPNDRGTPGLPVHHLLRGVYSNSGPSSWWCYPTISYCVLPFSSRLQSFPASASFQMSQLFASGGQSIGVLASTSVLPMNIQDWFPLGWTGWISLQSNRLSRVSSNTTVQKHQFFGAQLSL